MKEINTLQIPYPESLGNDTLYDLCKNNLSNKNPQNVSAKTWIIGRCYAVSPQRRKTKKTSNNKYNFFFDNFASIFVKSPNITEIDELINKLNSCSFNRNYDDDKELIKEALDLVNKFNSTVIETIGILDNCNMDKDKLNQNISFSSKYIHFHCPNIVFIYDSYSKDNATKFIKNYKKQFKIDQKIKQMKKIINNPSLDHYISHFIKCYFISIICNKKEILTPRQVDTLLLTEMWKQLL